MTKTEKQIEKEVEDLDREATEALDRLAAKREELQRQLETTELTEKRLREREEERRSAEAEEAKRKAEEEAKARREKIAEEMGELDAEREGLAKRLAEILERYQELNWDMFQEVNRYNTERANGMAVAHASAPRTWVEDRFSRWL
jgi:chromosome segregation ATPase